MKKLIATTFFASIVIGLMAQAPNLFSYQAVVRNNSDQLIINSPVGIVTTILQGSPSGTIIYRELHYPNPQTNSNGLVTLEIGSGLPLQGAFSNMQLDQGPFYIKTEIDPTGGTNYTISGTSQFLSVPYALYASKSGEANPVGSAGGDLTGTYPNPVVSSIQGRPVVSTLPITDNVLKWTGSTWAPQPDGLSLPYTGSTSSGTSAMSVTHTAASGANYAGYFATLSTTGTALYGEATSLSGTNYAIMGHSSSPEGYAAYFTGDFGSRNYFQQPVGIGTAFPNYSLESIGIIAATEVGVRDFVGGTAPLSSIRSGSAGGGTFGTMEFFVKNAGTPTRYLHISATGNVSIGTNYTGSYKLQLQENSAAKPVSSSWTVPSDQRLKRDIHPFSDGLELVKQINPVWFTYTGEARMPNLSGVGLLAQELQKLAPYMVRPYQHVVQEATEDQQEVTTEYLAIDFGAMDFILINAIQEQQAIIETQNERITSLEQTINEMRQMMLTHGIKAED